MSLHVMEKGVVLVNDQSHRENIKNVKKRALIKTYLIRHALCNHTSRACESLARASCLMTLPPPPLPHALIARESTAASWVMPHERGRLGTWHLAGIGRIEDCRFSLHDFNAVPFCTVPSFPNKRLPVVLSSLIPFF